LENPEVGVAFSNNDSPDPLRFIKMSNFVKGEEQPIVEHFEVNLKYAHSRTVGLHPKRKFFFDTNVTAVLCVKNNQFPTASLTGAGLSIPRRVKKSSQPDLIGKTIQMNLSRASKKNMQEIEIDDVEQGPASGGMCWD
jgi:hypothetical protein